ncbi:tetratricopeptide repeat protein [Candidatus Caldatribacterium sp.]|uniref:tetratricopeptide repeat protein n=1 Tax=Candidatus Caldatribacterium sp. TaxID=2282143 RepID=UPI002997A43F|nr:tetratricopeptide repeat protein [Candidatus Caldatribacterium sp.]MDW8081787.1 tetratricopeptide repeat protein [Candidatus Calescibacterium sp.]
MQRAVVGLVVGVLFAVLVSGCFSERGTGNLTGAVWDATGPVSGVLVEGGGKSTFTDGNGQFLLEDLPAGKYYVFFSHPSYAGVVVQAEVVAQETRSINAAGKVVLPERTEDNLREYLFTLYELGFYERVVREAEGFLLSYPGSAEVTFLKGASLFFLGKYREAVVVLEEAAQRRDHLFADDAQYLLAKCCSEGLRDYGRAITEYRKLVEMYPESEFLGNAWYEMGDCYYILGSFRNALETYEKAQEFGGEIARKALYSSAHCLYRMELYNRSASKFLEYVAKYPDTDLSDDAQYFAGAAFYRAERFADALQAFDDCVRLYPNGQWYNGILIAPAALFHKGLCLEKLGRYVEAYHTYLDIIRKYPGAKWADGSSLIQNVQFRIDWLRQYVL